jgi:hypothetical protein
MGTSIALASDNRGRGRAITGILSAVTETL